MSKKIYSDKQIISFHKQYLEEQISIATFSKNKNLSYYSLWKGFKRLNLKIIPNEFAKRKFPVNDNYFEIIDTEEKAYILGFIYADGCNHEKAHRLEISLAKKDEDILIKISKILLNGNVNIKEYKTKLNRQNKIGLYIVSQKICNDLSVLGCVPKKTFILKFPILPSNLLHHFIRGYFDGDGMLAIYERIGASYKYKNYRYEAAEFSIVSTKEMLDSIGNIINSLGVNFKINKRHKNRPNNNFTLSLIITV